MSETRELLRELEAIALEAGNIAQKARENLGRELKPDGSVVTRGDRLTEEFLREKLPQLIQGTTVWGEEYGHAEEGPNGLWAVDPVDGTTNYAFGSPLWGTTIGLVRGPSVELGVVRLPDLDETYSAALGQGATLNGKRLAPIPPGPIAKYEMVSYSETALKKYPGAKWPGKWRCSGSFVVEASWVATQRYRGMVGIREQLYDIAGSYTLNLELGADIRYANGRAFSIEELKGGMQIDEAWLIFPGHSGFRI